MTTSSERAWFPISVQLKGCSDRKKARERSNLGRGENQFDFYLLLCRSAPARGSLRQGVPVPATGRPADCTGFNVTRVPCAARRSAIPCEFAVRAREDRLQLAAVSVQDDTGGVASPRAVSVLPRPPFRYRSAVSIAVTKTGRAHQRGRCARHLPRGKTRNLGPPLTYMRGVRPTQRYSIQAYATPTQRTQRHWQLRRRHSL